jgi:hypothetical protein
MSSTTYQKFSFISKPMQSGSASHWPPLPVLDLTSALHGKSIRVPINSLPLRMNISYDNVFHDPSSIIPQIIFQDPSRCTQEHVWCVDSRWTSLSCFQPPISQLGDYTEQSSCVHNVPNYL